jgi:hypothetical protein
MRYLLILFLFISCDSKEEPLPNITQGEMFSMATKADPNMKILIGTMQKAAVTCSEYKIPCKIGYLVRLKNMEIKVLYYINQDKALESAKRLRAYVSRNWVFDDVRGEPILERLIVKHMDAKPAF